MSVEVYIPGFIIDGVEYLDADDLGADLLVANRLPAPGEVDVPIDSLVSLDILATDGGEVDDASVRVYVAVGAAAEVLAYHGGTGFESGFSGALSAAADIIGPETRRIVIERETDWPSLETITVRVVAEGTTAAAIDVSYAFTIEDRTPPVLVSAFARTPKTVRVTFDEAMLALDATALDDALNPANYAFENFTIPSVSVAPVSVTQISATEYDVEVDFEWTFLASYRVTVSNVTDDDGNVIDVDNVADFLGFDPQFPANRRFDLWRMLPQKNRDEDFTNELRIFIAALQDVVDFKLFEIDEWTSIVDVDRASEPFLDAMLDDLGNPFAFELDADEKRRLIRVLVPIYKQKGTAVGIINVIRFFLGIETTITPWHASATAWILGESELGTESELGPSARRALYSYEIATSDVVTAEQIAQIRAIAEYMQPAHTHLVKVTYPGTPPEIDHLELGLSELGSEWILH